MDRFGGERAANDTACTLSTHYPKVDLILIPAEYRRQNAASQESLGRCPRCGGSVTEGGRGFGRSNWKRGCKFVIWKQSKLLMMVKTKITKAHVKAWLSGPWETVDAGTGAIRSRNGVMFKKLVAKSGKTFEAKLFLEDRLNSEYGPGFHLEFEK